MPGSPKIALSCPGGTCDTVNVTVRDTATGGCELDTISDLNVSEEDTGEKRISWTIPQSAPYEWSDETWRYAISVVGGDDPVGKFGPVNITGGGKKLVIHFQHVKIPSVRKNYKYALAVRRSANPKQFCKVLDPWLIS